MASRSCRQVSLQHALVVYALLFLPNISRIRRPKPANAFRVGLLMTGPPMILTQSCEKENNLQLVEVLDGDASNVRLELVPAVGVLASPIDVWFVA